MRSELGGRGPKCSNLQRGGHVVAVVTQGIRRCFRRISFGANLGNIRIMHFSGATAENLLLRSWLIGRNFFDVRHTMSLEGFVGRWLSDPRLEFDNDALAHDMIHRFMIQISRCVSIRRLFRGEVDALINFQMTYSLHCFERASSLQLTNEIFVDLLTKRNPRWRTGFSRTAFVLRQILRELPLVHKFLNSPTQDFEIPVEERTKLTFAHIFVPTGS